MDLDLDISGDQRGAEFLDQLVSQNIDRVEQPKRSISARTGKELAFFEPIQKITPKHHAIARLVAEGHKDVDIAAMTGYTAIRVYQLKNDKSFADLVLFYQSEISAKYTDVHEVRREVGLLAMERLKEKLLDDEVGPSLSAKSLTEIAEFALSADKGQSSGPIGVGGVTVNITYGKPEDQNNRQPTPKTIDLEVTKESV